ncbi:MAG: InlB B-repeat-containing protein, partial [Actinomycetes bacterium]
MNVPKSRRIKKLLVPIASLGLLIGILSPVPNAFAANLTTPTFRTVIGTTSVVLTMSGGTCSLKAAPLASSDFTFAGSNAAAFGTATYTRTSNTVVTITGLSGIVATTSNSITVLTATQATACTSAAAASVPIAVTSAAFATLVGGTSVRVTLTSGTYKAAPIAATDFTFTGTNAAALALGTFTRTSSTLVTITGITLAAAANNVVTVLAATQATQATVVTGSVVAYSAVTSPAFTTVAGGTSVTITQTGGSFITGTITASNFAFSGTNAAALAAGIFTRTSSTVVTIDGLNVVAAVNNTVQVLGPTQAAQVTSVAGAAVPYAAVTSPTFSTAAGTTSLTITITGGTFKTGTIAAADFIFAGTDAARLALGTFARTSSTLVTITGLSSMAGGVDNTVQVRPATQSTQVASVLGAAPTHTTTYNLNGGSGTIPTQSPVSEGSGFLTALSGGFANTGFNFTNWNTALNGSGTSYAAGSTYIMGLSNVTLYAQWAIATFAITVTPGVNGTIVPGSAVVNYGANTSNYIFTPSAGYSVSSIIVDGSALTGLTLTNAISSGYTFSNVTTTHTLAATFALNAITWNDQGATTPSSGGSSTYTTATAITAIPTTAPLKSGYTFTGWNSAANGLGTAVTSGSYTPPSPYGAISIYAQWSAVTTNAITWNDQGATTPSSGGS